MKIRILSTPLLLAIFAFSTLLGSQAWGMMAGSARGITGQKKEDFQSVVNKKKTVIMEWVRDVSEGKKKADLEAQIKGLDWTTLKALDQQLTYEWQQYLKKPEAQTANGIRIIGRFKQAQKILRDTMEKTKPPR